MANYSVIKYQCEQHTEETIYLRLLSLEKPACKVGHWLASGTYTLGKFHHSLMKVVHCA